MGKPFYKVQSTPEIHGVTAMSSTTAELQLHDIAQEYYAMVLYVT